MVNEGKETLPTKKELIEYDSNLPGKSQRKAINASTQTVNSKQTR